MRHTEQEGAGGGEEEVSLNAELATRAYRKSEMMRSGAAGKILTPPLGSITLNASAIQSTIWKGS